MNGQPTMLLLRATWKDLNKLVAGALFEEFLPGGIGFESLATLGVIDNLASKDQIGCYVGGNSPKRVQPEMGSLVRTLQRTRAKDSIDYEIGGTTRQMGLAFDELDRRARAQLRMGYSPSSRSVEPQNGFAVMSLSVRELGGLGKPGQEVADFITRVAQTWLSLDKPLDLVATSGVEGGAFFPFTVPTRGPKFPYIYGAFWLTFLRREVVKVLGGDACVIANAPVQEVIAAGDGLLCRVGRTPADVSVDQWREWKNFLLPVLGGPKPWYTSEFLDVPWILPEDREALTHIPYVPPPPIARS